MATRPSEPPGSVTFGDDFELNLRAYQLRSAGIPLKLKPIHMELLIFLVERQGELVTREQIVERIWGKGIFLDSDNSINSAISKIRQALRDNPEAPRFVQTVTGKGYRFLAPVVRADLPVVKEAKQERGTEKPVDVEGDRNAQPASRVRRWVVVGGVALVALIAGTYILKRSRAGDTARPRIKSLAVLPLKNLSGDPTREYLADGMTESLIGRLSRISDLRVISRTSVMHFKDTQLTLPEIARALGADAIVEGSVTEEGGRIRITAQLIRGATDEHVWSEAYDRELRDVLELESEVAQSIARKVEVTVTGKEQERLATARAVSPAVYESYLKGRFTLNKRKNKADIEQSIAYFQDAITRDPTFALSYAGLAAAYANLATVLIGAPPGEARIQSIKAARKALELDPALSEAHLVLADAEQKQFRWPEAEAEYLHALDLNPNDAAISDGYAIWLLCHARIDEALAWEQRARERDPIAVPGGYIGWIFFQGRRYDEAIREFRGGLAVQPDDVETQWYLGMTLIADGRPREAIPLLEKVVKATDRSPAPIGMLISAYAKAGKRGDALRLLAELKKRKQGGYVPAAAFVNAYLGLGEFEQALVWLEQGYKEQSNMLQLVKIHPFFDPLRGDPRFADLVRRVGLD